jgi:hypothetical protein
MLLKYSLYIVLRPKENTVLQEEEVEGEIRPDELQFWLYFFVNFISGFSDLKKAPKQVSECGKNRKKVAPYSSN